MAFASINQASVSGGSSNALSIQSDGIFMPRLSTGQRTALALTTSDAGLTVYDFTLNNLFIWNGAAWESIPGSGDAGANGSVQYNDNGIVSGATNFVWDKVNGRVGVGTATPSVPLYVTGNNATATAIMQDETNGAKLRLIANSINFDITNGGGGGEIAVSGANPLTFKTNGTERVRVDSAGMVGIGVTPSAWSGTGSGQGVVQLGNVGCSIFGAGAGFSADNYCYVNNNAYHTTTGFKYFRGNGAAQYAQVNNSHRWLVSTNAQVADTVITFNQAMTLDASGNLLVGKTARDLTTTGVEILPSGQTSAFVASSVVGFTTSEVYSTTAVAYRFYVGMNGTVFATNTVISAISDARLKENVQDLDVGLDAILALKPRKFDWKAGKGKDIKGDRGFIAQEFETVFPNLIDEWKDHAPEGEAPYKSVRADLIPVLVKAIQELTARVKTLESR